MIRELFNLKPYKYANYNQMEMLPYLTQQCGLKVAVYGAGYRGEALIDCLRNEYGIEPKFVIDKTPQGNTFNGIPEISAEKFIHTVGKYFVIVAVGAYSIDQAVKEEIDSVLSGENVVIRMNGNYLAEPFRPDWRSYIKQNVESFEHTYELLEDEMSRETYIAYLKTFITGERFSGITFPEEYKYWGIDNEKEKMFELGDEDVWLNCGACQGDTIYNFLKCRNRYKKIIAVEADDKVFPLLKRNLSFLNIAEQNKIQLENVWIGSLGGGEWMICLCRTV